MCTGASQTDIQSYTHFEERRKEGREQGREKWRDRQRKKKKEREIKKDRNAFQFPVGVS